MDMAQQLEKCRNTLKNHGQEHLLAFWDQLDENKKKSLLEQIEELDFAQIDTWICEIVTNDQPAKIPDKIDPADFYPAQTDDPRLKAKYEQAVQTGKSLIAEGKVAAFVVAGGQGTRLGFDGPKGDFPITPVKHKTLFRLAAEKIQAASDRYGRTLKWYVMTSPLNHRPTLEIFKSNQFLGLDPDTVFIFQQGTLPNFSPDGKILLADKGTIASSPDGHGGSLKALYKSGAVADMQQHGIEYVSYFQIDNPLINIFDPLFIGLHADDHCEMSSKGVSKTGPDEKVGNFCLVDGKVTVIEYSDLPDELAEKRRDDGSLLFEMGSIAIHIISRSFVEKLNAKGFALPLHRAVKKIPHINENGKRIEPDKPNGIKLETFVFDAIPAAANSIVLETIRSEEFAPVKNASGVDSAESSRKLMVERAANWLEAAGVSVPRNADGSVDAAIEIAPRFALDKEQLAEKADAIDPIRPGESRYLE